MSAKRFTAALSGLGLLAAVALLPGGGPAPGVLAAGDDIAGTVTGASGPEAGVWVIAETGDFDTSFRKTVVTDDAGRFLVPDLPDASYEVWVRGYGLVDSEKASAQPGERLDLTVRAAATPREAAGIYPANYWYSLLEVPPASDFPGTGPRGNGIGTAMRTQADWIDRMKDGCQLCHQLGNYATREMPMLDLDDFDSTADAWNHRIQAGGAGPAMAAEINRIGRPRAIQLYAEWTDRIRAGEVPPAPPRPQGVERNVVLTSWGWGHPRGMVHDNVSTDKRNPTLYPDGPIYGVGGAGLVITDISARQSVRMDLPTRDRAAPARHLVRGVVDADTVALLGRRAGGAGQPQRPQPDDGRPGPALDHPGGAARTTCPAGASRGPTIRSRGTTRFSTVTSRARCPTTIPRPASSSSSTPASSPTTCSSPTTPTTPSG